MSAAFLHCAVSFLTCRVNFFFVLLEVLSRIVERVFHFSAFPLSHSLQSHSLGVTSGFMSPGFYFQFVACLENVINNARLYNSNIESRHLPSSPDPTQPSRNPHPFAALLALLHLLFPLSFLWMNLAVEQPEQQPWGCTDQAGKKLSHFSKQPVLPIKQNGKLTLVKPTVQHRVVSELSHSNYCLLEERIARVSLGRKPSADEMWGNSQSESCWGMLLGRGILYDCLGKADPKETVSKTWFLIQRKHHGNLKAAERGPESKSHPPRKSLVQFELFCCVVSGGERCVWVQPSSLLQQPGTHENKSCI